MIKINIILNNNKWNRVYKKSRDNYSKKNLKFNKKDKLYKKKFYFSLCYYLEIKR